jgi:hypothetical protein
LVGRSRGRVRLNRRGSCLYALLVDCLSEVEESFGRVLGGKGDERGRQSKADVARGAVRVWGGSMWMRGSSSLMRLIVDKEDDD